MRLDRIDIEACGPLKAFTAADLAAEPLLVVHGPNESGKTSLRDFLVTLLYGYAPAPAGAGRASGRAQLRLDDGRPIAVQRNHRDGPEGRLDLDGESRSIANAPLPCLGPIPRETFLSLHAPDGRRLPQLDEAGWDAVRERLLVGGGGEDLRDAPEVQEELAALRGALWQPDGRGLTAHRQLTLALRRLARERDAAHARALRLNELREALAADEHRIAGLTGELREDSTRVFRAEVLLPVLRAIETIEDLRARAAARLERDDLPTDARGHLAGLAAADAAARQAAAQGAAQLVELQAQTVLGEENEIVLAAEDEVRALVSEAAVHHQDRVHLNDIDRERDALQALLRERGAALFARPLDETGQAALARLPMAELQGRLRAAHESARLPELAAEEVARAEAAVQAAELDFEALASPDAERKLRQREESLRGLQVKEDLLATLTAALPPEPAKGQRSKERRAGDPVFTPRQKAAGGLIATGLLLAVSVLTDDTPSWGLVAPIAAGLCTTGGLLLRRKAAAPPVDPERARCESLAAECAALRTELGLVAFETTQQHLDKAREKLAFVAERPERERRLVAARQTLAAGRAALDRKRVEVSKAVEHVRALFTELPLREERLARPGLDLADDLSELRALLRDLTRRQGERQAVAERARELDRRAEALAETLHMVCPASPMDGAPIWHERLQQALAARRRAQLAGERLPEARRRAETAAEAARAAEQQRAAFERRLAALADDGRDAADGLDWLEQARGWRAEADALERALREKHIDWAERGAEARAAREAGLLVELAKDEYERLVVRVAELREALRRAGEVQAQRLDEQRALAAQRPLADVEGAIAALQERRDAVADEHDRLVLLSALCEEADRRHRARWQAPALAAAASALTALTGGAWTDLLATARDGRTNVRLQRADGTRHELGAALSGGLADQAGLLLRLALARAVEGTERLPLMLDEPFGGWDEARTQRGIELLARFGTERQVIVFTADASLARRLAERARARLVELPEPAAPSPIGALPRRIAARALRS